VVARATARTSKHWLQQESGVAQVPPEIWLVAALLCAALWEKMLFYMENLYVVGIRLTRRNKTYL